MLRCLKIAYLNILLQENVDALIECVIKDVGFSQGKPVAAFTIYKCLMHRKSLEAEKTSVFDRLMQMIGAAIEVIRMHHPSHYLNHCDHLIQGHIFYIVSLLLLLFH